MQCIRVSDNPYVFSVCMYLILVYADDNSISAQKAQTLCYLYIVVLCPHTGRGLLRMLEVSETETCINVTIQNLLFFSLEKKQT